VHGSGVDQVHQHQGRGKSELGRNHGSSGDSRGLEHLQADKQVHALVLRLLQQSGNPAVISLKSAERAEVAEASGNKAGNASNGFQHNQTPFNGLDGSIAFLVASDEIEGMEQSGHLRIVIKNERKKSCEENR